MASIHNQPPLSRQFLDNLVQEIKNHPVNTHPFFCAFKEQRLSIPQLQTWLRQYHYFCKHFVKLLEGLLYKTPVDELEMRVELAKTLHSELGDGDSDCAHIRLLERFAESLELDKEALDKTTPFPEVSTYLSVLHRLFVESDYLTALGSELAVEVRASAEFHISSRVSTSTNASRLMI